MNLKNIDLNLSVYLDVLLRESNVTRAARSMGWVDDALANSGMRSPGPVRWVTRPG